ncbi:MAG: DUF1232 domain-containing protein [Solobacterium sp.]|nr:DUF1232 domain-containing protein [Solobacterium sp.]
METSFDLEKAKAVIDNGIDQAQELIQDPAKIDGLLDDLQTRLKEVPTVGTTLSNVPLMISMVKSYITKEYTAVSPRVIAAIVSSFLYFVKRKDLIPDNIPLIGHLDDIGVAMVALKMVEPELSAYAQWRQTRETPAEKPAEN